jgi:UDP-glucose 4-epimerase
MDNVDVVLGDVRDPSSAHAFVGGAEVVYHLAALIAVQYSYVAPRSYLETNAGGALNVLEAARAHETPRLVMTSTSEVYGTAIRVPIDETHPLQAQSPYAASKIAADKLAESYHLSFGLPVVTLRPFNTFGPRQSARAVIPTIMSQLAADQPSVRLGALTPTRDFTFVTDTAAAFLAVGGAPSDQVIGRVFNAGTGREIAIGDLAAVIAATMGRTLNLDEDRDRLRPQSSEVMRLVCDSSALRTRTGWGPRVSLEDGLAATSAWFSGSDDTTRYRPHLYGI